MAAVLGAPKNFGVISENKRVTGTSVPLAKLGTVVATVARIFVPNYSAAIVTKMAQYPLPKPMTRINV